MKTHILLLSAWLRTADCCHVIFPIGHFFRDVKAAAFDYLPARKMGVLTSRDRTKRKAFAQQCKKILSTKPGFFW